MFFASSEDSLSGYIYDLVKNVTMVMKMIFHQFGFQNDILQSLEEYITIL